jgi:hypothetical protein
MNETVEVNGEERPVEDLVFVSLVGPGLVVGHKGWAIEELQGPGQVPPDPMEFGEDESYTPRNAVEAKELLHDAHRQGNRGAEDWFALYDGEEASAEPTQDATGEIPDGYAKIDGELVPVEDLMGGSNGEADPDTAGLEPLTAPGEETITTKQGAYEALAAAGLDLAAEEAPNVSDSKDAIVEYAHEQGYHFPNYE